jgi:hypothetical protein
MPDLSQMNYEDFGKLRFLDFFPTTKFYSRDDKGGLEAGIGLACSEGYLFTGFASPIDSDMQTAEILITFEQDYCPEAEGNALLKYLGLGIRKGMSHAQVRAALGIPIEEAANFILFIIGKPPWPYYVSCGISEVEGLFRVWICRKDLADEEIARIS